MLEINFRLKDKVIKDVRPYWKYLNPNRLIIAEALLKYIYRKFNEFNQIKKVQTQFKK